VEDILSAIKVSRLIGVSSVACLSSGLMQFHINRIAEKKPERVGIFLDNDNIEVRRSIRSMQRKFSLATAAEVCIIESNKDPKEHTMKELRDLLTPKEMCHDGL
jgi:hypothetical protein